MWETAIKGWSRDVRAGGLRRDTVATYRQRLERTARHVGVADPWAVTGDWLLGYFGDQEDWDPETRRGHKTALRSFYGWAFDKGLVTNDPTRRLPKMKAKEPNPMPAPDSVYLPALAEADARETLALRLAAEHGMRRGEIVLVDTRTDMVEELHGWTLVVHGKGGKDRVVPLLDEVARLLLALPRGYAFPGAVYGHMSARWCGTLINRLLPGAWTMHKLRHKAATQWWEASEHDLLLVAELLGHASTDTTRRYVKSDQTRHRDVVNAAAARVKVNDLERRRVLAAGVGDRVDPGPGDQGRAA